MINMKKWFGFTLMAVAVVLSGCGGGGGGGTSNVVSQPTAGGGTVADGYIAGATVRTQSGQNLGKTNQKGDFRIPQGIKVVPGTILTAQGGYDVATNEPFTGTLKSVYGGNGDEVVISPLTTLVAAKYQQDPGATLDTAIAEVAKALGLPKDAVTADPVKNGDAFVGAQTVMSAAKIIAAAGSGVTLQGALETLGRSVRNGDLNWTAALHSVKGPDDMAGEIETTVEKIESMTKALLKESIPHDAVQNTLEDMVEHDIVGAIKNGEDLNSKLDKLNASQLTRIAKVVDCLKEHKKTMLGENVDFQHVKYALNLQGVASACEDSDITVSWIEKHGYIDPDGSIKKDEHGNVINVDLIAIVQEGDISVSVKFPLQILPIDNTSNAYIELQSEDVANKLLKVAGYDRSILFGDAEKKTGYLSGNLPGADYNYTLISIRWHIDDRGEVVLTDNQGRSLGTLAFEKVPEKGVAGRWTHADGTIERLFVTSSVPVKADNILSVKSYTYLNKVFTFEPLGMDIAFSPENKCWMARKVPDTRKKVEEKCSWSVADNRLKVTAGDLSFSIDMSGGEGDSTVILGDLAHVSGNIEGNVQKNYDSVVTFIHKIDYYNFIVQYYTKKTHITDVRKDINGSVIHAFEGSLIFNTDGTARYITLADNGISRKDLKLFWSVENNNSITLKNSNAEIVAHIDFYNKPGEFGIGSVAAVYEKNKKYPLIVTDYYKIKLASTAPDENGVTDRIYKLLDSSEDTVVLRSSGDNDYYFVYSRDDQTGDWEMEKGIWEYANGELRLYDFNHNEREAVHLYGTPDRGVAVEYHDLLDNETDRVWMDNVIPLQ